jgi:hypothetical protein
MPRKFLLFLTWSVFLTSSLWGRIGETEAQLISRFGEPISRGMHAFSDAGKYRELCPSLTFTLRDWMITCDLIDGTCARISYQRTGDWTEAYFESILDANRQGGRWTDLISPNMKKLLRKWRRDDGIMAEWVTGSLVITSPLYEKTKMLAREKMPAGNALSSR